MWGNLVKVTRYVSGKCWIKTQIFLIPKSSALIAKGGQVLQWNHPLLLVCHFLLTLGKANLVLVIWLDGFSKVTRRKLPLARVNRDQETPKLQSFQEIKSTLSNVVKYFCLIQSFLGINDKKAFWRTVGGYLHLGAVGILHTETLLFSSLLECGFWLVSSFQ